MKKIGFTSLIAIFVILTSTLISNYLINEKIKEFKLNEQKYQNNVSLTNSRNIPVNAPDFIQAAEMAVPAVVHIKTKIEFTTQSIFDFFFGNPVPQYYSQKLPIGSGVIISSDGYIVTNHHVINNSDYIEVTLNDKRTYKATLVASDPSTDIALLKIDADNLPYLSFGNSDELKVGEWVLAVGNPFNLTSTVTAGIVSAKARNIGLSSSFSIEAFIQTDAAVNPGNSGGALVNTRGELVGINTAIASQTGSYIGYAFAIPSNIVKKVVSDFIKYGEVQRVYLGINILQVDHDLAKEKGLSTTEGVYVQNVYDGSTAQEGGILPGDVIKAINGNEIKDIPQLQERLSQLEPGQKATITVLRGNKTINLDVVLKNTKNTTNVISTNYSKALGAKFQTVKPEDIKHLRINYGVKVVELSSGKLKAVGIKPGFIITSINGQPVKTAEEVELLLTQIKGNIVIEGIYPNGMYAYYSFYN
jgi:Do/DeqQ family serine protease